MEEDILNKWTELKHSKSKSYRFSADIASEVQFCNICHTKIHVLVVGQRSPSLSECKLGKLNNMYEG
jgi:hypothetical protein